MRTYTNPTSCVIEIDFRQLSYRNTDSKFAFHREIRSNEATGLNSPRGAQLVLIARITHCASGCSNLLNETTQKTAYRSPILPQLDHSNSRTALPAPPRFASFISEYLRERMTPGAPARKAAWTAPFTLCGVHLLWP